MEYLVAAYEGKVAAYGVTYTKKGAEAPFLFIHTYSHHNSGK